MNKIKFELKGEYIHLIQLLKFLRLVDSGGMAKMVVDDGLVYLNNQVEYRKRAKLIKGDLIVFENNTISIE